ncbi:MAG: hypothetical protein WCP96_21790, partial [Methylococcaceae bacterium]
LMGTINLSQVQFNTIQAQFILRRLSGDFYFYARRGTQNKMLSLTSPVSQSFEPSTLSINAADTPCAELTRTQDIILSWTAVGMSEGFKRLLGYAEEEATLHGTPLNWNLEGKLDPANIFLAYAELVISLDAIKADVTLVEGEPLVRTKTVNPGELKTLQAKVYFDLPNGGWATCLRPALNSIGLDFKLPANGPVPDTSVEWIGLDGFGIGGFVEFKGDPVHTTTNDQGIGTIGIEGVAQKTPLPNWLQKDYVRPVENEAAVTVNATMKPTELFKDLPDVVGGAVVPLTIPKEILQRTKLFVASYPFKVKDWESNVFSGGGTIEQRVQTPGVGGDYEINWTFLVSFGFNEEEGMKLGGEGNADITYSGYTENDSDGTCTVTGGGESVALNVVGNRHAELGWSALATPIPNLSKQIHCVYYLPDGETYSEDFTIPFYHNMLLFDNAVIEDGAVLKVHSVFNAGATAIGTIDGETRISRQPVE